MWSGRMSGDSGPFSKRLDFCGSSIRTGIACRNSHRLMMRVVFVALLLSTGILELASSALARDAAEPSLGQAIIIAPRRIFVLLFLMLGPLKILAPFVEITRDANESFRRQLALLASGVSAAAVFFAGILGPYIISNFEIPLPVLALAGGLVLSLVSLNAVLEQFSCPLSLKPRAPQLDLRSATALIAYPTIVTPPGIAAVIVFSALAKEDERTLFFVAGITFGVLLIDCVAMIFAQEILKWTGPAIQVLAVVLGVVQVAIGLQLILRSSRLLGILPT